MTVPVKVCRPAHGSDIRAQRIVPHEDFTALYQDGKQTGMATAQITLDLPLSACCAQSGDSCVKHARGQQARCACFSLFSNKSRAI
jgi:hypothetical protein